MKIHIMSLTSLIILILLVSPHQAFSFESNPAKLLASLNSKTAEINQEFIRESKGLGRTEKFKEVYSYTFSLDQNQLKVEFDEQVRLFTNDQFTRMNHVNGTVLMDLAQVGLGKTGIEDGAIHIVCLDEFNKRCITRDSGVIVYNDKKEIIMKRPLSGLAGKFRILGADKPMAEQISKDLKILFAALGAANQQKNTVKVPAVE